MSGQKPGVSHLYHSENITFRPFTYKRAAAAVKKVKSIQSDSAINSKSRASRSDVTCSLSHIITV